MPRPNSPSPSPGKGLRPGSREGVAAEGVGEEDPQGAQGFHVGLAPANLRPPQGIDIGQLRDFNDYIQISMSNIRAATLLLYRMVTYTVWLLVPYGRLQLQQVLCGNWEVIYP